MTEEEYKDLKERLIEDAWAWVGHKAYAALMFCLEYGLRGLGACWPVIVAWLRKNGFIDV